MNKSTMPETFYARKSHDQYGTWHVCNMYNDTEKCYSQSIIDRLREEVEGMRGIVLDDNGRSELSEIAGIKAKYVAIDDVLAKLDEVVK